MRSLWFFIKCGSLRPASRIDYQVRLELSFRLWVCLWLNGQRKWSWVGRVVEERVRGTSLVKEPLEVRDCIYECCFSDLDHQWSHFSYLTMPTLQFQVDQSRNVEPNFQWL